MKHSEIPITWKEIEELGLEEVPLGYEQSDDEQNNSKNGIKYGEKKDQTTS